VDGVGGVGGGGTRKGLRGDGLGVRRLARLGCGMVIALAATEVAVALKMKGARYLLEPAAKAAVTGVPKEVFAGGGGPIMLPAILCGARVDSADAMLAGHAGAELVVWAGFAAGFVVEAGPEVAILVEKAGDIRRGRGRRGDGTGFLGGDGSCRGFGLMADPTFNTFGGSKGVAERSFAFGGRRGSGGEWGGSRIFGGVGARTGWVDGGGELVAASASVLVRWRGRNTGGRASVGGGVGRGKATPGERAFWCDGDVAEVDLDNVALQREELADAVCEGALVEEDVEEPREELGVGAKSLGGGVNPPGEVGAEAGERIGAFGGVVFAEDGGEADEFLSGPEGEILAWGGVHSSLGLCVQVVVILDCLGVGAHLAILLRGDEGLAIFGVERRKRRELNNVGRVEEIAGGAVAGAAHSYVKMLGVIAVQAGDADLGSVGDDVAVTQPLAGLNLVIVAIRAFTF